MSIIGYMVVTTPLPLEVAFEWCIHHFEYLRNYSIVLTLELDPEVIELPTTVYRFPLRLANPDEKIDVNDLEEYYVSEIRKVTGPMNREEWLAYILEHGNASLLF